MSLVAGATTAPGRDVVMFSPDAETVSGSQLTAFMRFCEKATGQAYDDYALFHDFSVAEMQTFWLLLMQWSGTLSDGSPQPVCTDDKACEQAVFFPDLRLSYVGNLLRIDRPEDAERLAVVACHAARPSDRLSRGELRDRVLRVSTRIKQLGIRPGDRVVAIVRNNAEALVACLAAVAVGATFSAVATDTGVVTILDRFEQLEAVALIANLADEDPWSTDLSDRVGEVARRLTSLKAVIALDDGPAPVGVAQVHRLSDMLEPPATDPCDREFARFAFNHPLFILFSSGTTGRPKCIVHGAGGTLLEHIKEHRLHTDLRSGDTLFFQTSAAWMMWNWQLSALASGAAIVLYDGPIAGPDTLWRLVEAEHVTVFGTSPPYLQFCEDSGYSPRQHCELPTLRAVLSTGSILHAGQYDWVRDHVGALPLQSISGGTDIIGCFVLGNPNLPVHRGDIQCRSLGIDVQAATTPGSPSDSRIGELVCRNPFPSRPLGLVGDDDGRRFHDTYFSQNDAAWTQGDLVEIGPTGHVRMHGRSDGVLNIRGVRIGPAEIYRVLRDISEISEAMAIEQRMPGGPDTARLVLLVVLRHPETLDQRLVSRIRRELSRGASPAHVPQLVVEVAELPITHSGKRSERAVRDALNGMTVVNAQSLRNPYSLDRIVASVSRADEALRHHLAATSDLRCESTEKQLLAIWESILGIAGLAVDDNFFEVGGTSLTALRLLNAVDERFGVELPLSTLLNAWTVRSMADVVDADGQEDLPLVVLLKPGTGEAPLFIVHGMFGGDFHLRTLAEVLQTDRPVYSVRARGLNPGEDAHTTVVAMAEEYVRHVRKIQPTGPYAFAGHSFGGLVAFEMGRLVTRIGEAADAVILIDTYVHEGCLPPLARWRFRVLRSLRTTRRQLRVARRTVFRHLPGTTPNPASSTKVSNGMSSAQPAAEPLPPQMACVGEINTLATKRYRPTAYAGSVIFVRATHRLREFCDPIPIWTRLARGGLVIESFPGGHDEMLVERHVEVLAELLDRHLLPAMPHC